MKIFYILIVILQVKIYDNANILGIAPLKGKSHFIMFESLFKGLAAKGHNVDVISHFPLKKSVPRYNDLVLDGNFPNLINNITVDIVGNKNVLDKMDLIFAVGGTNLCKEVLDTKTLNSLKNTTKKYDLLITEFFAMNCMLGFSHLFKIPAVVVTTSVILPWATSCIGLPDNPSYIPTYFTSFTPHMSLAERVINTAIYLISKTKYDILLRMKSNAIAKRFFGSDMPDLGDLANNVSLLLVNSHFSVHMARPAVPNFIEVAGLHINENTVLPKYYQDSLKTDLKGVIYLSFGSMLLTESFPEHKLRALFKAFEKIPYKIMWKAIREKFPKNLDIPSNIQFESWMPQMGILCHPNVKLFISHGGMMGTLEALHCGVPVLGIPVFADQSLNIKTIAARGFALHVPYESITEESIGEALEKLLNDPSYEKMVKRASTLFKDRPASAMETAIYWIEYVIRHNGATHLRSPGADLPWYQYYLIDVLLVFFIFILSVIVILYYIFVCIFSTSCKKITKPKLQ